MFSLACIGKLKLFRRPCANGACRGILCGVLPLASPNPSAHAAARPAGSLPAEAVFPPGTKLPEICAHCWIVDNRTPPAERVRILDDIAVKASRNPLIVALAQDVAARIPMPEGPHDHAAMLAQGVLDRLPLLVEYRPDPNGYEVFQTVEWTFGGGADGSLGTPVSPITGKPKSVGDCEDLATAYAALMLALGVPARVKWWDQPQAQLNHVSALVQLQPGGQWLPAETTIPGSRIGEDPYQALARHRGGLESRVFG